MTDRVKVSETINYDDLTRPKGDLHLLTAFFIILFGFSIQFMVFPTYVELEKRTTERFSWSMIIYSCICTFAYIAVGTFGTLMFGDDLKSDFLINMAKRDGAVSIFIRVSYIIILNVHIPYFFFTVKEYILVLIDEINNRSLS